MLDTLLTKRLLVTNEKYIKSLNKGGIFTVGDLLNYFPKDIEDRTNVLDNFSFVNLKEKNTVFVKLISLNTQRTSNNKLLTKAIFEDKNGFLSEGVWFNRNYLASTLNKYLQKNIIIIGKVKYDYGKLSFVSPEVETDLAKQSGEIVPIYSDFNYIPGTWFVSKMKFLREYIKYFLDPLPQEIIKKYNFISKPEAIEKLHFPLIKDDFLIAKNRLAYDELYDINFKAISTKIDKQNLTEGKSIKIPMDPDLVKDIIKKLPYELTNHQKISLFQILKDMDKIHSMQRLLQGDVGTGKTIVAAISIINAIIQSKKIYKEKIQVAIIAPTEILARQHFHSLDELFMFYSINSSLLVGSLTKKQKGIIKENLKSGNIDVIIGTHALVQEDVKFLKLGFVIIDEQHRFGVKQRDFLEKTYSNGIFPHVLNMTATPIPRTLALTLYGDQDLSIINEYPENRKVVFTKIGNNDTQRENIILLIKNELQNGRQIFWISPLVQESEKIDLANAISTYHSLVEIFSPFHVGLLHGKMKAKEKEEIMNQFKENKIQILSSTSVVEVGVNIPNATIICIEGAERFGLSQLHQFRGRVGRGEYKSYCYLFPTNGTSTDRLRAMEKTNNGFELSEIDLELRGPGEVYGVRQSGLPEFKIASMKDLELVSQIREDIENYLLKK